jgi:hypothetical protein
MLTNTSHDRRALNKASWSLAMGGLCARSYWRRLWILQELRLARNKTIMCGAMTVPWHCLEAYLLCLDENSQSLTREQRAEYICNSPAMHMVKLVLEPLDITFWKLLDVAAHLHCEQMQDRAYALLGFATVGADGIEPDYNMSVPVLMNMILEKEHQLHGAGDIRQIAGQCDKLEEIFGLEHGAMLTPDDSRETSLRHGPIFRRLYNRHNIHTDITPSWIEHYQHARVRRRFLEHYAFRTVSIPLFSFTLIELIMGFFPIVPGTPGWMYLFLGPAIWTCSICFLLFLNVMLPDFIRRSLLEVVWWAFVLDQILFQHAVSGTRRIRRRIRRWRQHRRMKDPEDNSPIQRFKRTDRITVQARNRQSLVVRF